MSRLVSSTGLPEPALPTTKSMLLAAIARELALSAEYRVLRRVRLASIDSDEAAADSMVAVAVDCECTGLEVGRHKIIELATRRFRFDRIGRISKIGRAYAWLEDPGEPLDAAVSRLTGLTDADVAGRAIDDRAATAILRSADVVIAHNCEFDRKFVERRLPGSVGRPWACSLRQVGWAARGFNGGRSLPWLLYQAGFFYDAHRAADDVDALIALLALDNGGDRSVIAELIETASKPTWLVRAVGAHYDARSSLKKRGYHWDADEAVWCREVAGDAREAEETWLSANVYAPEHTPRMDGPLLREVTWETRYG